MADSTKTGLLIILVDESSNYKYGDAKHNEKFYKQLYKEYNIAESVYVQIIFISNSNRIVKEPLAPVLITDKKISDAFDSQDTEGDAVITRATKITDWLNDAVNAVKATIEDFTPKNTLIIIDMKQSILRNSVVDWILNNNFQVLSHTDSYSRIKSVINFALMIVITVVAAFLITNTAAGQYFPPGHPTPTAYSEAEASTPMPTVSPEPEVSTLTPTPPPGIRCGDIVRIYDINFRFGGDYRDVPIPRDMRHVNFRVRVYRIEQHYYEGVYTWYARLGEVIGSPEDGHLDFLVPLVNLQIANDYDLPPDG